MYFPARVLALRTTTLKSEIFNRNDIYKGSELCYNKADWIGVLIYRKVHYPANNATSKYNFPPTRTGTLSTHGSGESGDYIEKEVRMLCELLL